MITDRHDPMNLFEPLPQLNLETEPQLGQLDRLLEDDEVSRRVKVDPSPRCPHSAIRRRQSTPVEAIPRMTVARRLCDWSYEETERFGSDSLVLRRFCLLYPQPTPHHPNRVGRPDSSRDPGLAQLRCTWVSPTSRCWRHGGRRRLALDLCSLSL